MTFLIYQDNETRDYNGSIDFYDHQIDSIIGPTMKTVNVEHKIKMPKCVKLFTLHTEFLHRGCYYAINVRLILFD